MTPEERERFFTPEMPADVVCNHEYYQEFNSQNYGGDLPTDQILEVWRYASITESRATSELNSDQVAACLYPGMLERACFAEIEIKKRIYQAIDRAYFNRFSVMRDWDIDIPPVPTVRTAVAPMTNEEAVRRFHEFRRGR